MMYWANSTYVPSNSEIRLDYGIEDPVDFSELATADLNTGSIYGNDNLLSDALSKAQAVRDVHTSIDQLKQEFEKIVSTRHGLQMQLDKAYNNNDPQRIRILGDVHKSFAMHRTSLVRRWSTLVQDQKRLTNSIEDALPRNIFKTDEEKQDGDIGDSLLSLLTTIRLCSANQDALMALQVAHRLKELP
jgi:hypothetical protein